MDARPEDIANAIDALERLGLTRHEAARIIVDLTSRQRLDTDWRRISGALRDGLESMGQALQRGVSGFVAATRNLLAIEPPRLERSPKRFGWPFAPVAVVNVAHTKPTSWLARVPWLRHTQGGVRERRPRRRRLRVWERAAS